MEYAIAIFVGLWICAAGLLSYRRIKKDFRDIDVQKKESGGAEE